MQKGLDELRNKYLGLFLAFNIVFVISMYFCMTYKDRINVPWLSYKNTTITDDNQVSTYHDWLKLWFHNIEPNH